MAGQGRPNQIALLALLALCVIANSARALPPLPPATQATTSLPSPAVPRTDAELTDIAFSDPKNGCAVGDRGAIWRTADGGKRWELQESGVDCRLECVQFVDAKNGWAAGGLTQPYTHTTSGVILHTHDGGLTWKQDRKLLLPAIKQFKFFDAHHGWVLTEPSALHNAGVFTSEDGGRSWAALPAAEGQSWLAGDFLDMTTGALAGHDGALATIRRKGIEPARNAESGLRALHKLKFTSSLVGWLVGDGGLALRTDDAGKSWQTPAGDIPAAMRQHFDLLALDAHGERIWIAGSPGSRVLHSADGGRSWSLQSTGQNTPLSAIRFLSDNQGYAVGALGTILATTDGGRTWRKQRASGARAALVGFFSQGADLPLELLARLSADEGYLAAIELLNRQDLEVRSAAVNSLESRLREAVTRAGGSSSSVAWQFPLRSAELKLAAEQVVDGWNRANDGQGLDRLENHLVAKIRMWRPELVVTSSVNSKHPDATNSLINQLVLRAVERAADPAQFAEQTSAAGLAPWKVQKVYAALPPGELGNANITTAQLAVTGGGSIADLSAASRGLISEEFIAPPATQGFRLLVDHIPQELGKRDFFSGISLQPGGEARRMLSEAADQNVSQLRKSAQARRNLQAILAKADEKDPSDGRLLAEVGEATRGMDERHAAELLFHLAQRYHRGGRWDAAADTFDLLVTRYPKHALAGAALEWLVQYYASGEAGWRMTHKQQLTVAKISAHTTEGADDTAVQPAVGASGPSKVQRTGGVVKQPKGDNRAERAANYARQLEQLQPSLHAEPSIRFPLAVANRNQGLSRQAERFYLGLRRGRQHDAWWSCAQGEQWLLEPQGDPPKSVWFCNRAAGKPRLDGKLDDPMWRAARPVELSSPLHDDAEWPCAAMLAYDDEFLYLAASCRRVAGVDYEASKSPRTRDADLSAHDRVEFYLDTDRDYSTYYRLSVDHRGSTAEALWQDPSWNPNWFVASSTEGEVWNLEAAIPLSELTGQLPQARHAWSIGARRIVPGVGSQTWSSGASSKVEPQSFGLLIFQ